METETTFDFKMPDSEYIYNINSNIILHIKQVNYSVAILYFTDELGNKINIPDDILVYTYDNSKEVLLKPIKQQYALCWTDDYIIKVNDKLINIKNQRQWNIIS